VTPPTPGLQQPLLCPGCGARYLDPERFCPVCALPLIRADRADTPPPASARHRHARLIKPQLSEGELVQVAGAGNLAEAEFIQSLLLEEGVPSLLRRSAGFDVPDLLAAGPRDILVPRSGVDVAREVLLQAELIDPVGPPASPAAPGRLLLGLIAALAIGAFVVWLIGSVLHS